MRKLSTSLAMSLALLCGGAAVAKDIPTPTADIKISVIDLHQILQQSPQSKKIGDDLKKQFKSREAKVTTAQSHLKKEMDKFKREESVMSAAEREKFQSNVRNEQRELARMEEDFRTDLNLAQNQAIQKLLARVRDIVSDIAKKEHVDLVLQKDAVPFASSRVDMTDRIVKELKRA